MSSLKQLALLQASKTFSGCKDTYFGHRLVASGSSGYKAQDYNIIDTGKQVNLFGYAFSIGLGSTAILPI